MSDGGGYGRTLCEFDRVVAYMELVCLCVCSYMCLVCVCGVYSDAQGGGLRMRIFKRREEKVARGEEIWVLSSLFTRV